MLFKNRALIMTKRLGLPAMLSLAFLLLGTTPLMAAYILTDTLWVKVIFYDFHADSTNPNYQPDGNCGNVKGMVQDTLDADRKPVLLADVCFNHRISEWWRPSGAPPAAVVGHPLT